jgi:hypothetical protein
MAPIPLIDALFSRTEAEAADPYLRNFDLDSLLQRRDDSPTLSPIEAHDLIRRDLIKRDSSGFNPGQGTRPPTSFNNQAFLALFAVLGALMVLASMWFFFWAKNGGFHFQEGDWEDYKSTVLRRKGPDGRTLSNATKSTKLGSSTIAGTQHYKWAKTAARSVVSKDEKGRKGVLGKRGWAKTHSITYSDDFTTTVGSHTVSDMTEIREMPEPNYHHHSKRYRDRDMHDYKKERPARVGGLNRVADGSHIDTSYNGSETYSEGSERPILQKPKNDAKEKERAERNARIEAAKMERRWKKEAEEAAAALARESARSIPQPKKTASPSRPSASKQQQRQSSRSASRSASPKKREHRDFSYQTGPGSEVLSSAYTGTTSNRTASASYYDAYRPRAASSSNPNLRYSTGDYGTVRQPSPKKKATKGAGGYRRGADSDFD